MIIRMSIYPEWRNLLNTKMDESTPIAERIVQDDDPTPYRQDQRLSFEAFPNHRHRTHQAVLECSSDNERYKLYFKVIELPDENLEKPLQVFQRELDPSTKEFTFNTDDIEPRHFLNPNQEIKVIIEEYIIE